MPINMGRVRGNVPTSGVTGNFYPGPRDPSVVDLRSSLSKQTSANQKNRLSHRTVTEPVEVLVIAI
jgi:hypothetical protein